MTKVRLIEVRELGAERMAHDLAAAPDDRVRTRLWRSIRDAVRTTLRRRGLSETEIDLAIRLWSSDLFADVNSAVDAARRRRRRG